MNDSDRIMQRAMLDSINAFSSILTYGYTDDGHDEVDLIIDRLRHAHVCVEADMNNEPIPTFADWFRATYNSEYREA